MKERERRYRKREGGKDGGRKKEGREGGIRKEGRKEGREKRCW